MEHFEFNSYSVGKLNSVLEFIAECPALPYGASQAKFFLTELARNPSYIFDLQSGDGGRVIAAVLDTCENADNSSELAVLGLKGALPARAWTLLLERAEQLTLKGPRDALDVTIDPSACPFSRLLEKRGFTAEYETYWMEKNGDGGQSSPLPSRWEWREIDEKNCRLYFELARGAFHGQREVSFPPYEVFRNSALQSDLRPRLLMEGNEAIAFCRVKALPGNAGEIMTIGRSPSRRGTGLGEFAIREAVRVLKENGATRWELSVSSSNWPAVKLYEREGFLKRHAFLTYRKKF